MEAMAPACGLLPLLGVRGVRRAGGPLWCLLPINLICMDGDCPSCLGCAVLWVCPLEHRYHAVAGEGGACGDVSQGAGRDCGDRCGPSLCCAVLCTHQDLVAIHVRMASIVSGTNPRGHHARTAMHSPPRTYRLGHRS